MFIKPLTAAAVCLAACIGISGALAASARADIAQTAEPIRGVNLGGLFVLEPWITPSLFEEWAHTANTPVVDEWNYCAILGKHECQSRLTRHWGSWVQEQDIATLSDLRINTLRIPLGYWALAPNGSDP
ncbi:hypothetical protein GGF48_004279, partial [Coemansia sp. RSA 921]